MTHAESLDIDLLTPAWREVESRSPVKLTRFKLSGIIGQ